MPDGLTTAIFDANRAGIVPVVRLSLQIDLFTRADGGIVVLHPGDPGLDFAQKLFFRHFGAAFGGHGGLLTRLHPGGFRVGLRSTPLGDLDQAIRLFGGIFFEHLSQFAQKRPPTPP